MLKRLRWGQHGYASLRQADLACPDSWDCAALNLAPAWAGNWLHPRDWNNHSRLRVGCLCCWLCDAGACAVHWPLLAAR